MSDKKIRLDQLLVQNKLVETRSQAKAIILAGKVLINNTVYDKAGDLVDPQANVDLKQPPKYVSRGGLKLEAALKHWHIAVRGKVCLDVGASTGGFTDCLLKSGAKKVYAVDVGYGQLSWRLQQDQRVIRFDRENFRHFDRGKITDAINLIVMDVSFISIKYLVAKIVELFEKQKPNSFTWIALIKPQFEVGRKHVKKGGIVKDASVRKKVVDDMVKFVSDVGFVDVQVMPSPITGADGNVEYLMKCHLLTSR